jgi:ADP-ribose pyrophosphatase
LSKNVRIPLSHKKNLLSTPVFQVFEQQATLEETKETHRVFTLETMPWVSVLPVTSQGEVILVEQHRFGTDDITWELPGGAVQSDEKDFTLSALREMEEETGYTSHRIISLPRYHPNPAILNNTITFFIAYDVVSTDKIHPEDPFEIINLIKISFKECIELVKVGKISASLSALGICLAEPYMRKWL